MQDLLPFITHFRSAYNFSNASTVAATFLWTFLSCTTRKPVWKFRKQRAKGLRTHTAITRSSPFWVIARRNWEQVSTPIYLYHGVFLLSMPFLSQRPEPHPVNMRRPHVSAGCPFHSSPGIKICGHLNEIFKTKSLEKTTSFPGFSPISRSVGRCHSDMGIPAFWASPFPYPLRFGHPRWGMLKTLIASTLPKLFQTGEKSGLSITNLRLNSVDAC